MKKEISNISVDELVAQFNANQKNFPEQTAELKENAISSFRSLGIPSVKNEEWKYTNLASLVNRPFHLASKQSAISRKQLDEFIPVNDNAVVLIFVNGQFDKDLSRLENQQNGIIAGNIADHISHPAVTANLGRIAAHKNESFVALNTAMFLQGAFIHASPDVIAEEAIHMVFINDASANAVVSFPRNLIVAETGASLKISESCYSIESVNSAFTNSVTEIVAGENSSVEYCKVQSESNNDFHIDYSSIKLKKNSRLDIHTVTTGGKIVRNNLNILLADRNATAHLNGLFITGGDIHVDNHSFVDHASPDCYSNELYKGVLGGKSSGVFNGKIFVRRDAQKTNAYQSNKNILVSKEASMNAKPQLEIYADDVKCSHGATTGQLDEEALFYLRSRGIGFEQARALLTIAFAEDILERITIKAVREKLESLINERLKGI